MNINNVSLHKKCRVLMAGVFAFVCLSVSLSTQAQYSGYYFEGFYGSGTTEFKFLNDLSDFSSDSDFYGLTVGRRFNDNVSVEASYVDLGESQSIISDPLIATFNAGIDARAIALTLVGTYPLNRYWTVFGKLGFNQWDLEVSAVDERFVPNLGLSAEDRGSGINYGAGVQYRITPTYAIKVEYVVYQLNPEVFSDDVPMGGATIALRFNY